MVHLQQMGHVPLASEGVAPLCMSPVMATSQQVLVSYPLDCHELVPSLQEARLAALSHLK